LRKDTKIHSVASKHVFLHFSLRLNGRFQRVAAGMVVFVGQFIGRAIQGQGKSSAGTTHVGDDGKVAAGYFAEEEDWRTELLLEFCKDGGGFVAWLNFPMNFDEVGRPLPPDEFEKIPKIMWEQRHGKLARV